MLGLLFSCRPQPGTEGRRPVGDGAILYSDDFTPETTGKWQLEGDESGRTTLADGRLLIEVNSPNTLQYTTLVEETFSNFALEVEATLLAGSPDSSYGVLFRMSNPQQFYRFDVTANGLFVVERYDAGEWIRLSDGWEANDALAQGINATNYLGVLAVGGNFSFYANGKLLLQVVDGRYGGGNIALDAGTFAQPGLQVAFDNLVIRSP